MADKPTSPFSGLGGLDKALLRSTSQQAPDAPAEVVPPPEIVHAEPRPKRAHKPRPQAAPAPERQPSGEQAGNRASQRASELASYPSDLVDRVRKVVKAPGREVSFIRLSPEEKATIADIVYTYKRRGQRTTETDINRIALNLILEDYQQHGEQSFLARVLEALQA